MIQIKIQLNLLYIYLDFNISKRKNILDVFCSL